MLETQENISATANIEKNISDSKDEDGDMVIFTQAEWNYFQAELDKQISQGENLNFKKATNNARYLARLDAAFANIEAGRWTEHELIEVDCDE